MAKQLLGKEVTAALNERIKNDVATLQAKGVNPTLCIIRVGENPSDISYEKGATKRCETLGVACQKILLPVDTICANDFDNPTEVKEVPSNNIPEDFEGLDIGPKTREIYAAEIAKAKTVFWNGPMGVFEKDAYQAGTIAVCKACADLKGSAFTVIGGGDSAAACKQFGYKDEFSHVSTGGGASLEMIENNGHLPGIDVIGE